MEKYFIESPAPTPNGGLHLGHIAGPYLAADIFNRVSKINGHKTFFACDLDRTQSYVRINHSKKNSNIDLNEFIQENTNLIKDTFAAYDIGFDYFNDTDNDIRKQFIFDFISPILKSKYIFQKEISFYFDDIGGNFLVEGFISGECQECGTQVKGGFCEICGYYNFSTEIDKPYSTLHPERKLSRKNLSVYILDIKSLSKQIISLLDDVVINYQIREMMKLFIIKNPCFPITLPLIDGLQLGNPKTKLSPWIEVLCGTYFLKDIANTTLNCNSINEMIHVCFSGFDNAYYFTVICNAIRLCLNKNDFPIQYHMNRYYSIDGTKFSTSRNHAVWAHEILNEYDINMLRLFLASTHPENCNCNFNYNEFVNFANEINIYKLEDTIINHLMNNNEKHCLIQIKCSPIVIAENMLSIIRSEPHAKMDNLFTLMQVLFPSLSTKIIRKTAFCSHIVKKSTSSFTREYGITAKRLMYLDEYNFTTSIGSIAKGEATHTHKHDDISEIFYVINGSGDIFLNEEQSSIADGDYIFVSPGTTHRLENNKCCNFVFLSIAWKV